PLRPPGRSELARGQPPPPGNSSPSSRAQYLASRSSSLAPRLILEPCPGGSPAWLPSRLLVGKGNANAVPSPKHRGELLDDPGEVVEGVSELVPRRHRVVTEAGVVGSEHAVAVGQGRDQVADICELVGKPCRSSTAGPSFAPASRPKMPTSRALIVRWATFVVWIMGSLGFGSGVSRYLQTASGPGGQRAEKRGEPFCHRRVDHDRIAQRRVGQACGHR